MLVFIFLCVVLVSNFVYQLLTDRDWEEALKRSYFEALGALIWVVVTSR